MSLKSLFGKSLARLGRTTWGAKIRDREGIERDTGVNQLAQEIASLLGDARPLELTEPIQLVKKHSGPLFNIALGQDAPSTLATFTRNGEEVAQASTSADGSSTGTNRVTQNIANAIGSLYRVASISENGLVTLDEIDASGNATGTQIQARQLT